jgi:hypothetical protein
VYLSNKQMDPYEAEQGQPTGSIPPRHASTACRRAQSHPVQVGGIASVPLIHGGGAVRQVPQEPGVSEDSRHINALQWAWVRRRVGVRMGGGKVGHMGEAGRRVCGVEGSGGKKGE